jgi:hypothetical protein
LHHLLLPLLPLLLLLLFPHRSTLHHATRFRKDKREGGKPNQTKPRPTTPQVQQAFRACVATKDKDNQKTAARVTSPPSRLVAPVTHLLLPSISQSTNQKRTSHNDAKRETKLFRVSLFLTYLPSFLPTYLPTYLST